MDNTKKDLSEALALSSGRLQLLGIKGATTERLSLKLNVWLHIMPTGALEFFEIICINAVDYAIRPRDQAGDGVAATGCRSTGTDDIEGGEVKHFDGPAWQRLVNASVVGPIVVHVLPHPACHVRRRADRHSNSGRRLSLGKRLSCVGLSARVCALGAARGIRACRSAPR